MVSQSHFSVTVSWQRSRDKGLVTKVAWQRSRDKGRVTKVPGPRSRDPGPGTQVAWQRSRDKGRVTQMYPDEWKSKILCTLAWTFEQSRHPRRIYLQTPHRVTRTFFYNLNSEHRVTPLQCEPSVRTNWSFLRPPRWMFTNIFLQSEQSYTITQWTQCKNQLVFFKTTNKVLIKPR